MTELSCRLGDETGSKTVGLHRFSNVFLSDFGKRFSCVKILEVPNDVGLIFREPSFQLKRSINRKDQRLSPQIRPSRPRLTPVGKTSRINGYGQGPDVFEKLNIWNGSEDVEMSGTLVISNQMVWCVPMSTHEVVYKGLIRYFRLKRDLTPDDAASRSSKPGIVERFFGSPSKLETLFSNPIAPFYLDLYSNEEKMDIDDFVMIAHGIDEVKKDLLQKQSKLQLKDSFYKRIDSLSRMVHQRILDLWKMDFLAEKYRNRPIDPLVKTFDKCAHYCAKSDCYSTWLSHLVHDILNLQSLSSHFFDYKDVTHLWFQDICAFNMSKEREKLSFISRLIREAQDYIRNDAEHKRPSEEVWSMFDDLLMYWKESLDQFDNEDLDDNFLALSEAKKMFGFTTDLRSNDSQPRLY